MGKQNRKNNPTLGLQFMPQILSENSIKCNSLQTWGLCVTWKAFKFFRDYEVWPGGLTNSQGRGPMSL